MNSLLERIVEARDALKRREQDVFLPEVRATLADAANAIAERDALLRELLPISISHYGHPTDESYGIGLLHAKVRAALGDA